METYAEDDNSITTKERGGNSSKSGGFEEEQSSITTENNSEKETDPWTTLINDAASKVRRQYADILNSRPNILCDYLAYSQDFCLVVAREKVVYRIFKLTINYAATLRICNCFLEPCEIWKLF